MCISAAVGASAPNIRSDVIAVQAMLNLNRARIDAPTPIGLTGLADLATEQAIRGFQQQVVGLAAPDGRVDPDGRTLRRLREGIGAGLSSDLLRGVMPTATVASIERYRPHLEPALQKHAIDSPLRQAHFLAQVAHESGAFRYNEEIASGQAYEGRADLGNTQPGDGPRFKGRGLIQLTGRANYQRYGEAIGRDLVSAGGWLAVAQDPELAVDVAGWFWGRRRINAPADGDDLDRVTRLVNGGLNGLAERASYLLRAKFFLRV